MQETSWSHQSLMGGLAGGWAYMTQDLVIDGTSRSVDGCRVIRASRALFPGDGPSVGGAVQDTLSVVMQAPDYTIPTMASIVPRIKLVSDRYSSLSDVWLEQGHYFVSRRYRDGSAGTLRLECVDAMRKADAPFLGQGAVGTWPQTDVDVVAEIAQRMGVAVDSRTAALMDQGFSVPLPGTDLTCRDVLGRIAALYGGNFHMSPTGELLLVPLWACLSDYQAAYGRPGISGRGRLLEGRSWTPYSRVVCNVSDKLYLEAGDDTGATLEYDCLWGTQASVDYVLAHIQGLTYVPYSCSKVFLDPAAELGDVVTIDDGEYSICSQDINILSALVPSDLEAPDGDEPQEEYQYLTSMQRTARRQMASDRIVSELVITAEGIVSTVQGLSDDVGTLSSRVSQLPGEILAEVADDYYAKRSSVAITTDGIEIASTGRILMDAGSTFEVYGGNISVDGQGNLSITGRITATAGTIGGCAITNGVLQVANANIASLNASKLVVAGQSIGSTSSKLDYLYADTVSASSVGAASVSAANVKVTQEVAFIHEEEGITYRDVTLSVRGVKPTSSGSYVSWAAICAGGSAVFG